ncbi:MAG: DUF3575 domain-containing protein [Muribaculaceae bacterium]|nr:DUF3575 domain-containing protein [Muribaculaceae bacterium]
MSKSIKLILASVLVAFAGMSMHAQRVVGLKTNLLYDLTATVNAGIEVGLAPKWSLDLSGNFNGWKIDNQTWKHWILQPEARYWLCDRFNGHFLAVHAVGGQFNWGHFNHAFDFLGTNFSTLKDHRAQGWGVGGGIAYGYAWILNKHWNFEAEIGVGAIHTWYDVYNCLECAKKIESDKQHTYFGPTKLALNIVYLF